MESQEEKRYKPKSKNITKSQSNYLPSEIGRMIPQAVELEEAVLGALLLEKDALNDVVEILKPEAFYREEHARIYEAICKLFNESKPVDLITVTEYLRAVGELEFIGGPYYIAQLTNKVASSANVEFHARIILQKHILRELISVSNSTIKEAYDDSADVFDLLDKAENRLFQISQGNLKKDVFDMPSLLKMAIDRMDELGKRDEEFSGLMTGFSQLDKATSGLQPSDLIIVAARPGMGKTAFCLSLARNAAADFKKGVAVFSLEMSALQLVNRLISSETEIDSQVIRTGKLSKPQWDRLKALTTKLSEAPLFIDDTPALSIFDFRAKVRRLKAQHDIQLIIIDYLQLMTGPTESKGNREQEISTISRSLKAIAKELNIPIIALSQLNRSVESRSSVNKKPQLSDLRESGAIEQDADIVMFIYRAGYYNIDPTDEDGNTLDPNAAELVLAKHRNGATGSVFVKYMGQYAKFVDYDADSFGSNPFQGMPQASEFETHGTTNTTFQSKINDDSFDAGDDEAPF